MLIIVKDTRTQFSLLSKADRNSPSRQELLQLNMILTYSLYISKLKKITVPNHQPYHRAVYVRYLTSFPAWSTKYMDGENETMQHNASGLQYITNLRIDNKDKKQNNAHQKSLYETHNDISITQKIDDNCHSLKSTL